MRDRPIAGDAVVNDAPSNGGSAPCAPRRVHSRRALLRRLGRPAAAALAPWSAAATTATAKEASADIDPNALLTRLVKRITMGINASEMGLANLLGFAGYLEHHLNHAAINDSAVAARLSLLSTPTMSFQQLLAIGNPDFVLSELREAVILRAQLSNRQLFERMVEFWTDHFNIRTSDANMPLFKLVDDREVIRANALGTFPALLSASAHSPAMLVFLDNYLSVAGYMNENYARELMELHTLGVNGGFTQQDVEEVARCFTGWTIRGNDEGALSGTFRYNDAAHDQGQKLVLGNIIPAGGGQQDGFAVLNILANHPSTALFISRKMCNWFLGPSTPPALVGSVAAVYTATGGDIRAMIRAILTPGHLHDSGLKLRRPFHLFIAAMRALPTAITSTAALRAQLAFAGHLPFAWETPDGFPDSFAYWSGHILPRWNFGASLLNGMIAGAVVDAPGFFEGLTTSEQIVDRIDQAMFGGEMPRTERSRIVDYLFLDPPPPARQREALGLAIASPSFQWY